MTGGFNCFKNMFVLKNVKLMCLLSVFFLSKIIIKYLFCIFALLLISIYPPPKRVLVLGTSTKCAYVEVLF
jgi:hypothetical protein